MSAGSGAERVLCNHCHTTHLVLLQIAVHVHSVLADRGVRGDVPGPKRAVGCRAALQRARESAGAPAELLSRRDGGAPRRPIARYAREQTGSQPSLSWQAMRMKPWTALRGRAEQEASSREACHQQSRRSWSPPCWASCSGVRGKGDMRMKQSRFKAGST